MILMNAQIKVLVVLIIDNYYLSYTSRRLYSI